MTRFRPHSRQVLRKHLCAWLTAFRGRVAVACLVGILFIGLEAFLLLRLGTPGPLRWMLFGAVSALAVAFLLAGLGLAFLVADATAIHQVRGAWGEDGTREELARARRRGHVWGWVDSVTVAGGDVDHLVVTRHGGLLALDSKWRSKLDEAGSEAMVREASKARLRAEGVVRTVLSRERSGRRADGKSLRVRPAVVLWGSAQSSLSNGTAYDGVDFVRGRDLLSWLAALEGDDVDQAAAEELLKRLERFRETAWPSRSC